MSHPLVDIVIPEALVLTWMKHEEELTVGPFTFPANVPVPVAGEGNQLVREGWLQVPFAGRPPIPGGLDGEGSQAEGKELLEAFAGGHLVPGSKDHQSLVDEVGRALLIHAAFCDDAKWCEEARDVFARAGEGATLFEILVRRAKGRIGEGVHFLEQQDGEQAMYEYLLARLLYFGAHLLSPTTPGVLYEMGVLTHDLAHQFQVDDGQDPDNWKRTLAREVVQYMYLALVDDGVRDETPALFLLAANRETVGELEGATSDYQRFLETPAAQTYPQITEAAKQRLQALQAGS